MGTVRTIVLDPKSCAAPPCGPPDRSSIADPLCCGWRASRLTHRAALSVCTRLQEHECRYKLDRVGNRPAAARGSRSTGRIQLPFRSRRSAGDRSGHPDHALSGNGNRLESVARRQRADPRRTACSSPPMAARPGFIRAMDCLASQAPDPVPISMCSRSPSIPPIRWSSMPGSQFRRYRRPLAASTRPIDGGANWVESSTGIAGQDVRALFIDPMDATGDTVYAGTGGNGANPGGVYRDDQWRHQLEFDQYWPAGRQRHFAGDAGARAGSSCPNSGRNQRRHLGLHGRSRSRFGRFTILCGERCAGRRWQWRRHPGCQPDGSCLNLRPRQLRGAGNVCAPNGSIVQTTIAIMPAAGGCTQLNDSSSLQANLYPPDPAAQPTVMRPGGWSASRCPTAALPRCA